MRLKKLRKQRADLAREANAALEAALKRVDTEGGGLSEEEQTAQEDFNGRIRQVDDLIRAEELRIERESSLAPEHPDAGPLQPGTGTAPREVRIEVDEPNLARDPYRGFRAGDEFDMAGFALAVRAGCRAGGVVDPRLIEGGLWHGQPGPRAAPSNFHQESSAAEGAMVPPQVSQRIWQLVFEDPLLQQLMIEPTSSNVVELTADETTPWGATGIQAKWRSEGAQMTPSKLETDPRQVRLQELYAFVLATGELLEDAPRLANRLDVKAPEAIRWKLVESFVFGTGAGQPLGWASTNYAGKVSVTRKTAAQINPDDPIKMYARLLVQGGPDRSFWMANRDTLPDIILRSVIGNVPIWLPANGLAGAPNGTILGRPLFFSEHAQTLGTAGDLQLVNPDGYYATQRGPARQDTSIHLYFDYNITAFRWMFRFGGMPMLAAAVSPAKGSSTKGHFVILT